MKFYKIETRFIIGVRIKRRQTKQGKDQELGTKRPSMEKEAKGRTQTKEEGQHENTYYFLVFFFLNFIEFYSRYEMLILK